MSGSKLMGCSYTDRRRNGNGADQTESRKRRLHQSSSDGGIAKKGSFDRSLVASSPLQNKVFEPNSCPARWGTSIFAASPNRAMATMTGEGSVISSEASSSSPSLLSDASVAPSDPCSPVHPHDPAAASCAAFPFSASTDESSHINFGGPQASTTADLQDKLSAMIRQDAFAYSCEDYLSSDFKRRQLLDKARRNKHRPSARSSPNSVTGIFAEEEVDMMTDEWREKMCEWSYQVIDHYGIDRETVAFAFSYLDRYVARRGAKCMRTFQLVAMTSLYLACKLHTNRAELSIAALIKLSRGFFTAEHVAAMELSILRELSWRVHPPTSAAFVKHLAFLVPQGSCKDSIRREIEGVALFLAELGVIDHTLVPYRKSAVAIAALLNATDGIQECYLSARSLREFKESIVRASGLNPDDKEVGECRCKLHSLYKDSKNQQQSGTVGVIASTK